MKKRMSGNWKKYGIEFFSIFIAVVSAFALNNWNENKRDNNSQHKILIEIDNGLEKDIEDIKLNVGGHQLGISACKYFRQILANEEVNGDSILIYYSKLTRDFISIQNRAGYETLKSKGLELISNDSLRLQIISLYEYDFNTLKKLEEDYFELQFQQNYFKEINDILAPNFTFDSSQLIPGFQFPVTVNENEKKKLLIYLWKIQENRLFILQFYNEIEAKINRVRESIHREIED